MAHPRRCARACGRPRTSGPDARDDRPAARGAPLYLWPDGRALELGRIEEADHALAFDVARPAPFGWIAAKHGVDGRGGDLIVLPHGPVRAAKDAKLALVAALGDAGDRVVVDLSTSAGVVPELVSSQADAALAATLLRAMRFTGLVLLAGLVTFGCSGRRRFVFEDAGITPRFDSGTPIDGGPPIGVDAARIDSGGPIDSGIRVDSGPTCTSPLVRCGTSCVDTTSDELHCGACDSPCDPGETCTARICTGTTTDGALRLVPGPTSGRLEVLHAGEWGVICDDAFDELDATVACRQLGFTSGTFMCCAGLGAGTGPIHMDDLDCTGSESTLASCPFSGWGVHNCTHSEDVGVVCTP